MQVKIARILRHKTQVKVYWSRSARLYKGGIYFIKMNYHAPAFNPFGCIERWEVDGGVLRVTVKEGPGALQLGAAAAVRKFADDAASGTARCGPALESLLIPPAAFISDMLRRYNDSEGARANSR